MKNLFTLLFIARVLIPMHVTIYENVVSWEQQSHEMYLLTLTNGKTVIVPTMWTVIEEK